MMSRLPLLWGSLTFLVACAAPAPPTEVAPPTEIAAPTPTQETPVAAGRLTLTWYGHATFLLESPQGVRVLMDPAPIEIGYEYPTIANVDAITTSHEHFDHVATNRGEGRSPALAPRLLSGVRGSQVVAIDETSGDVRIRNVASYHDTQLGTQRGPNAIFVFEVAGVRIVHLGDLGHILTDEQIDALVPVDVLLIPVGGVFTIDARGADRVLQQLSPRVAIPMHYRTPDLAPDLPLDPVDPFLEGKTVQWIDLNRIEITPQLLAGEPKILVSNYR